jgi:putative glutamine amidotransferase
VSRLQTKPLVLVPACNRVLGDHPFHVAGKKYADAVRLAGCQPLIVPTAEPDEIDALLDLADGVLLTGSQSNVGPHHFGEDVHNPALPLDPDRDAWTLPLIPKTLARGIPLFAICRGAQETNVALGGSLHQAVHDVGPYDDHRSDAKAAVEVLYGLAHDVTVEPGGVLEGMLDRRTFQVNSIHAQAVNRLAPGLRVEARAPDGLIEAFSADSPGFNLCLQWHPEWQADRNPVSQQMLAAFGQACRSYHKRRTQQP